LREALGAEFPAAAFVSAHTGEGVEALREQLGAIAASRWTKIDVTVPHREGGLLQRVRERGKLRNAEYGEAGIHIQADVPADLAAELAASAKAARA
jgi:GTP-binding protein HflX